jgi:hypothetical protein
VKRPLYIGLTVLADRLELHAGFDVLLKLVLRVTRRGIEGWLPSGHQLRPNPRDLRAALERLDEVRRELLEDQP